MLETQPRSTVRTIVASFLFTDLVGFSKGTAAEQYAAKASFSAALRRHLAPLKESDYWIKDTGDGALIAFVSNPEHALYMALALAHDYAAPTGGGEAPAASLRTGLHLGTVKESIDVEARRNFIGDGINAAKRIMDFALPGQMAASRSFFEAIANLDAAYAALFRHVGASDDKHGRAHELYELAPSDTVLERLRADVIAEAADAAPASGAAAEPAARPAAGAAAAPTPTARRFLLLGLALAVGLAAIFAFLRMREGAPISGTAAIDGAGASSSPTAAPKGESTARPSAGAAPPSSAQPRSDSAPSQPASLAPAAAAPRAEVTERPPVEVSLPAATPAPQKPAADLRVRTPARAAPSSGTMASEPSSPHCSRILEKAALGEPLTSDEKKELANTCR
ncbi:MAG TPA: hypothetical protein VMN79_10005 [Casimicrobiaceae bacterium]|nr:hypothetical protein [Casimicrobiaceae bacterium]